MNLILVIGGTGSGKSRYTNEKLLCNTIKQNVQGKDYYNLSPQSKNQYIFDLNNEYNLPGDVPLKMKMRHVECNGEKFIYNCSQVRNTNIVFEDATGFLRGKQNKELIRLIVQKRHVNNNWIILFHSIYRVPPEIMEYANYAVIFKTNDSLKMIDAKFSNEKINAAFLHLQAAKKHSFLQLKFQ